MEQLVRKILAEKEPLCSKTSVTLIPSSTMKKELSRWKLAVSEKHGKFLKKLAASKKEKERRQSVLENLWEVVSDETNV
eukprot:3472546-Ditylum_brightwellii.AAC.1